MILVSKACRDPEKSGCYNKGITNFSQYRLDHRKTWRIPCRLASGLKKLRFSWSIEFFCQFLIQSVSQRNCKFQYNFFSNQSESWNCAFDSVGSSSRSFWNVFVRVNCLLIESVDLSDRLLFWQNKIRRFFEILSSIPCASSAWLCNKEVAILSSRKCDFKCRLVLVMKI